MLFGAFMSGPVSSILIFFKTLVAVCRVFMANRRGENSWIPLPPVAPARKSTFSMEQLTARVDRVVGLFVRNTAHPCLYYSYARCRVLRAWGFRVKLNLGMHNLRAETAAEGHCWLSLDDQVLLEETDPRQMYPVLLGEHNDVVYWARLKGEEGRDLLRVQK